MSIEYAFKLHSHLSNLLLLCEKFTSGNRREDNLLIDIIREHCLASDEEV